MIEAKPSLRSRDYCYSREEHLQRVVLKLYSSYFASELCRSALKSFVDIKDSAMSRMRRDCVSNLVATVEAYIEMYTISTYAARSWITLQRAISSIFLLAVIEEPKSEPSFFNLLQQMKLIVAEQANSGDRFEPCQAPAMGDPSGMASMPPDRMTTCNTIPGITNTTAANLTACNTTDPVPAPVAADIQAQWTKPLTKTLRALERLEAAFSCFQE